MIAIAGDANEPSTISGGGKYSTDQPFIGLMLGLAGAIPFAGFPGEPEILRLRAWSAIEADFLA
jgi:hypothetical protein